MKLKFVNEIIKYKNIENANKGLTKLLNPSSKISILIY